MRFLQIANTPHVKEKIGFDPLVKCNLFDLYFLKHNFSTISSLFMCDQLLLIDRVSSKNIPIKTFLRFFKDSGTVLLDLNIIFPLSSGVNKMVYSLLVLCTFFLIAGCFSIDYVACMSTFLYSRKFVHVFQVGDSFAVYDAIS